MPTKEVVEILCTPETASETLAYIIDAGREDGYTYSDHQADEDPCTCSLVVFFKRKEPNEKYVVQV